MRLIIVGLVFLSFAQSCRALDKAELDRRIRKLTARFQEMQHRPQKHIPTHILRQAQGVILLDCSQAGFIFAFQGGAGVAMVRDPVSHQWGPPAFVRANEASIGFQFGGQQSFLVILFAKVDAMRFLTEPRLALGGEARGTAGDSSVGSYAAIVPADAAPIVYSDREGLFGGAAIKAGALSPDPEANVLYYDRPVTVRDIIFGKKVTGTEPASELAERLIQAERPLRDLPDVPEHLLKAPSEEQAPRRREMSPRGAAQGSVVSMPQTNLAIHQLQLLLADLNAHKQTNALNYLNKYLSAMVISQHTADAAMTVTILERLRAGSSPEASELLELQLDGALIGLGGALAALPQADRPASSLKTLQRAKDYRTRFPRKTGDPNIDEGVASAWNLLESHK